jgi:hypothetical protein
MPKVVKKEFDEGQFEYLGRWVNKEHFRAFVYNDKGEEKLADSYNEYLTLTSNGIWFASKPDASTKRKLKNVAISDGQ